MLCVCHFRHPLAVHPAFISLDASVAAAAAAADLVQFSRPNSKQCFLFPEAVADFDWLFHC